MKIEELGLNGVYLITLSPHYDERGYFARTFCKETFKRFGLQTQWIQMSTSYNTNKGQVRGLHYQASPHEETKLIRCIKGSVLDIILDIRPESPTYQQHLIVELSDLNKKMLYVPKGFAHGYKTLEDKTELFYMMDYVYVKEAAREILLKEELFG